MKEALGPGSPSEAGRKGKTKWFEKPTHLRRLPWVSTEELASWPGSHAIRKMTMERPDRRSYRGAGR